MLCCVYMVIEIFVKLKCIVTFLTVSSIYICFCIKVKITICTLLVCFVTLCATSRSFVLYSINKLMTICFNGFSVCCATAFCCTSVKHLTACDTSSIICNNTFIPSVSYRCVLFTAVISCTNLVVFTIFAVGFHSICI